MQSQFVANNPFAVLTAIVAPAILTNACSVLALGISNRLGRVVDRTRVVASDIASSPKNSLAYRGWTAQMHALEVRWKRLLRALRLIYAALGLFAATALISVAGSVAAFYGAHLVFQIGVILAMAAGVLAVIGLTLGCYEMVEETRLAVLSLEDEAQMRIHLHDTSKTD
jgi:hypothetical protein